MCECRLGTTTKRYFTLYSFLVSAIVINTFISLQFIISDQLRADELQVQHHQHTNNTNITRITRITRIPVEHWGTKYRPIRVWCAIKSAKRIRKRKELWIVQQTWGKYCDRLLFIIGDNQTQHVRKTHLEYNNGKIVKNVVELTTSDKDLWGKCWRTYEYLYTYYRNDFDWIITADTDAWFGTYNFKGYAQYFDPQQAWYMGHTLTHEWRKRNVVLNAGGVFALSNGAIRKLHRVFQTKEFLNGEATNDKCTAYGSWYDDVHLGICLKSIGIFPINTLDERYRLRWSLFTYMSNASAHGQNIDIFSWYLQDRFEHHDYTTKQNTYATHPIAFHWMKDMKKRERWFKHLDVRFSEPSQYNWSAISVPQKPTRFLFNSSFNEADAYLNIRNPPSGQKLWNGVDNLWEYTSEV